MHNLRQPALTVKYFLLIVPAVGTLLYRPAVELPPIVILTLIIIINFQLRNLWQKENLLLASFIFETALILYLNSTYGGFSFLMLFSTLIDCFHRFASRFYLLSLLIAAGLAYSLRQKPLDFFALVLLFYISTFLFLLQLRKEAESRAGTESLYDRLRRGNYELEAAQARLLDYSKQVEKVAQLEERNRISRELHDSIGHSLAGILLQVDAALQLMEANPQKAQGIMQKAYFNINQSIETLRQTVRKLRPAVYLPTAAHLKQLIDKFRLDTGIEIVEQSVGVPFALLPSAETALYQNIREALTNAVRHGHARQVTLTFSYLPEALEVTIRDDGAGAREITPGFGLSGMRERLDLIGGSLSFNGENGFTVNMRIPGREG